MRPAPPPVFVDDTGRRRRLGRLLGRTFAALVASYIVVVGLTFAGVPLIVRLAPPGVARLSQPAGDAGLGVGPGAQESLLPAVEAAPPPATPEEAVDTDDDTLRSSAADASVTTVAPPDTMATTTTSTPGRSTSSSVPTPSSTVPENTHPTGGRPLAPPGKP